MMPLQSAARIDEEVQPPAPRFSAWRRWFIPLVLVTASLHVAVTIRETRRSADWPRARWSAIRWPDERNAYVLIADGVAEHGVDFLKDETILRSPPLPWAWLLVWNRSIVLTRFVNIALVIFGSYLVASVARARWGDFSGLAAFVLCACGYQVVLYTGTVLTEPLALFFCCAVLWAMDGLVRTGLTRYAVFAGLACGLGALSRTSLQLLPLAIIGFAAVLWLYRRFRRIRLEFEARKFIWLLACHAAVVAPVMAWNYKTFGVARIANGLGAVLYLGSDFRTDGDEPPFFGMQYSTGQITQPYDHLQTEGDALLMKAAKENIRRDPLHWLALGLPKIGRILVGGPCYQFMPGDSYSSKARLIGRSETAVVFWWWTVAGSAVAFFGVVGLALMWRAHPASAIAASALTVYLVLLHAATFSMPRFGLPFYPALVLGACGYMAARPPRWLTASVAAAVVASCGYLALYHQYVPRCVVGDDKLEYFTLDGSWKPGDSNGGAVTVETGNIEPAFNACLFVRATASTRANYRDVLLKITPRTDGPGGFVETNAFYLPLMSDGREHLYQVCVGPAQGQNNRRWQSLKFEPQPREGLNVRIMEVALGH